MGNELTASFNWADDQFAYLGFQEMISRLPLRCAKRAAMMAGPYAHTILNAVGYNFRRSLAWTSGRDNNIDRDLNKPFG
jgi:hypothetical protein